MDILEDPFTRSFMQCMGFIFQALPPLARPALQNVIDGCPRRLHAGADERDRSILRVKSDHCSTRNQKTLFYSTHRLWGDGMSQCAERFLKYIVFFYAFDKDRRNLREHLRDFEGYWKQRFIGFPVRSDLYFLSSFLYTCNNIEERGILLCQLLTGQAANDGGGSGFVIPLTSQSSIAEIFIPEQCRVEGSPRLFPPNAEMGEILANCFQRRRGTPFHV